MSHLFHMGAKPSNVAPANTTVRYSAVASAAVAAAAPVVPAPTSCVYASIANPNTEPDPPTAAEFVQLRARVVPARIAETRWIIDKCLRVWAEGNQEKFEQAAETARRALHIRITYSHAYLTFAAGCFRYNCTTWQFVEADLRARLPPLGYKVKSLDFRRLEYHYFRVHAPCSVVG
jgi:hypothetical protein